jgi:hypothetical protein
MNRSHRPNIVADKDLVRDAGANPHPVTPAEAAFDADAIS